MSDYQGKQTFDNQCIMEYLLFLPRTKSRSHDSALGEKKIAERVENQVNSLEADLLQK